MWARTWVRIAIKLIEVRHCTLFHIVAAIGSISRIELNPLVRCGVHNLERAIAVGCDGPVGGLNILVDADGLVGRVVAEQTAVALLDVVVAARGGDDKVLLGVIHGDDSTFVSHVSGLQVCIRRSCGNGLCCLQTIVFSHNQISLAAGDGCNLLVCAACGLGSRARCVTALAEYDREEVELTGFRLAVSTIDGLFAYGEGNF